jgi:hypothetical protein
MRGGYRFSEKDMRPTKDLERSADEVSLRDRRRRPRRWAAFEPFGRRLRPSRQAFRRGCHAPPARHNEVAAVGYRRCRGRVRCTGLWRRRRGRRFGRSRGLNRSNLTLLLSRLLRGRGLRLCRARCRGFRPVRLCVVGVARFRVGGLARDDPDGRFGLDHSHSRFGNRCRIGSLGEAAEQGDADRADNDRGRKLKGQLGRKPARVRMFLEQSGSPRPLGTCVRDCKLRGRQRGTMLEICRRI